MYKLQSYTLRNILVQGAVRYYKRPAIALIGNAPLSYREIGLRAAEFIKRLETLDIGAEEKVVLLSENRPEWVIAYLAITASGRIVVPILTDFHPEQIQNIIKHSEARILVVSEKLKSKIRGSTVPVVISIESILKEPIGTLPDKKLLEELLNKQFPPIDETRIAAILYTSGTTGHSKGVMLTHKNLVWDACATRSIIHLHRTDRLLSILPLAHTYECTIGMIDPIMQGSFITYLDKPPTASTLLPVLKTLQPTIMLTVPLIIEKIYRSSIRPKLEAMKLYRYSWAKPLLHWLAGIQLKKTFGGHMRFFGIGGSALSPDVEQFLIDAKFPYAIGYGLTETAPLLAGCGPYRTKLGSTGPALKGVMLRIASPDPVTGDGEIQAKGENIMFGYYKDPEKTKEVFTDDGWFKTGDLGHFDAQGNLYIRGRLKSLILGPSGENIYPEEIESILNAHEYVAESLVYQDGKELKALVVLKEDIVSRFAGRAQDTLEDIEEIFNNIKKSINSHLPPFSRIHAVELHTEPFEKTPSQKIKRFLYPQHKNKNDTKASQ
ncbi:MAG TPA: AMP-binding protein [Spirochaetales bacterium]|nr:AMP-binding protein [Spirochaetales bacterium]HQK34172.1 AMP-binding protein [Spirochaetales bacterium]